MTSTKSASSEQQHVKLRPQLPTRGVPLQLPHLRRKQAMLLVLLSPVWEMPWRLARPRCSRVVCLSWQLQRTWQAKLRLACQSLILSPEGVGAPHFPHLLSTLFCHVIFWRWSAT